MIGVQCAIKSRKTDFCCRNRLTVHAPRDFLFNCRFLMKSSRQGVEIWERFTQIASSKLVSTASAQMIF